MPPVWATLAGVGLTPKFNSPVGLTPKFNSPVGLAPAVPVAKKPNNFITAHAANASEATLAILNAKLRPKSLIASVPDFAPSAISIKN